nr:reverse transcriptase domain-containing protein [Tanacetum cinerariifolium]
MVTDRNGDPLVLDLRTMKELCQPTLNGRGGPIAPIAIQATNFGLKNDMIQQVQNSCKFHGLPGDDANKHLDKFVHVTQSIKVNGVTDDALHLYLFSHSLTHHATAWFDRLPRNSITTFEKMAKMFLGKYFSPSMVTKLRNEITNFRQRPDESLFEAWKRYKLSIDHCPNQNMRLEECYDLIENMSAHHNDWDTSVQRIESSSSITSSFDPEIIALKAKMTKINKNLMKVLQINQQIKAVTPSCKTYGGTHSYNDCPATMGQTQNVYAAGAYNQGGASHGQNPPPAYQAPAYQAPGYQAPVHQAPIPQPQAVTTTEFTNYMKENDAILKNMQTNMTSLTNFNLELKNMFGQFMKMNTASSSGSRTLPSTITSLNEDLKGITTRSGNAYKRPTIPTTSSLPKVVERETEVTKDTVPPTNNGSTKDVQPPVVQIETPILNSEPIVALVVEPIEALVCAPKPNQKPSILYPSRLHDQKIRDKTNDQKDKIFKIFQDLDFNISFADALIIMLKFGPAIKTVQHQRRVNPKIHEMIKKEVLKLLDSGLIYPILDSPWLSPVHCVPKKGGFTVVENEENELIPTRLVTGWRVWIDYRKLNDATHKNHFPLPFMDQMLERLARNEYYYFLDGFSGYFQIPIDPQDQENTTFTCPYRTFACRHMPFGLCNALGTFQRCMMAIFHDMIEKTMEVFMDDFSIFRNSFRTCLSHLDKMLKWCEDPNLCLNWEKSHLMVKEGIILGHKISKNEIEVDKAKVDVIAKLPHPTTVKGAVLGQRKTKHFQPIHYASKTMIDAQAHYTTTEKELLAVVFGTPRAIISDRGTHFCNDQFVKVMLKYGVTHRIATAYHPHTSGQVEVSNHGLKRILERTVGENHASWSDKLDDALWAFRTTFKTPIGRTPYKLVYGKACHLAIELEHKAYWDLKHCNYDLLTVEKTKRIHDSKIKDHVFNVGDRVLLFNSRLKIFSGKLKTRWSRPFTITQVFPYGTVELSQTEGLNFKVNGHRLKHYFGEDIPQMVVSDLQTFPKDQ